MSKRIGKVPVRRGSNPGPPVRRGPIPTKRLHLGAFCIGRSV